MVGGLMSANADEGVEWMIALRATTRALALALCTLAMSVQSAQGESGGGLARQKACEKYRKQALSSGSEEAWRRWRQCLQGWDRS